MLSPKFNEELAFTHSTRLAARYAAPEDAEQGRRFSVCSFRPGDVISATTPREFIEQVIGQVKAGKNPDDYDFRNVSLKGANLVDLDLRLLGGKALRQINFTGAKLGKQNFAGLDLRGAMMNGADLTGTDFEGAKLAGIHLEKAQLSGCDFHFANAAGAFMRGCRASGANLEGNFSGADLSGSYLPYCYFGEGSNFRNADLSNADLNGAINNYGAPKFTGARMRWAKLGGDFSGADFSCADLYAADFAGGWLRGAKFVNAAMAGTNLCAANDTTDIDVRDAYDLDHACEIAVPKPSFGSKYVAKKAQIIKLDFARPSWAQQAHRNLMRQFPVLGL